MSWIPVTSFKGLTPALDPRQISSAFIVGGRNFIMTAKGPQSYFGSEFFSYDTVFSAEDVVAFRVGDAIFLFGRESVLQYSATAQVFYPVFVFSPSTETYPWSYALVGGKYYFAKKGLDLLRYDPLTGNWSIHSGGDILSNIHAVTESAGRLIILAEGAYQWSVIDDGLDVTTNINTGAGAQSLALVGYGDPLGVKSVADGFVVATTKGLIKATIIDAANPFRHRPLSGAIHAPISPFNFIEIQEEDLIILSKTGLYRTRGEKPEPWQPLFSEFLKSEILPNFNLSVPNLIRLGVNVDKQWFIISLSELARPGAYTLAYVLYVPVNEWGVFNRSHESFGETNLSLNVTAGFNFGYFCENKYLHKFTDFPQVEIRPDRNIYHHYHTSFDYPVRLENDVYHMPSVLQMYDIDESNIPDVSGLYNQFTLDPYERNLVTINSYIDIGLFRFTKEDFPDRLSNVIDVMIGTLDAPEGQEFEDWLSDEQFPSDPEEDWLTAADESEDWGFAVFSSVDFDAFCIGTLDGKTVWEGNEKTLELTTIDGQGRFYSVDCNGLFHTIRVRAEDVDQSFQVKSLELGGNITGRLTGGSLG